MQTSLSVLTLEIYYRYLPLYKPEAMSQRHERHGDFRSRRREVDLECGNSNSLSLCSCRGAASVRVICGGIRGSRPLASAVLRSDV